MLRDCRDRGWSWGSDCSHSRTISGMTRGDQILKKNSVCVIRKAMIVLTMP